MNELPIIQKTYDLITWYVPIINRLPKNHRYALGERLTDNLYTILEDLINAKFSRANRLNILKSINIKLEIIRYQTRLLNSFKLMSDKRYQFVSQKINEIGIDLGGWIKQQQR